MYIHVTIHPIRNDLLSAEWKVRVAVFSCLSNKLLTSREPLSEQTAWCLNHGNKRSTAE